MNFNDLKTKLDSIGVNEQTYCLGGDFGDEQYCLEKINHRWRYYYSERGQKMGERLFDNESDACEYMYSILENDPTVMF
mgnify:CR=1 FL=1